MSTDEYVPSDQDMRDDHVQDRANPDAGRRQWDAWLATHDARVRRDAAREALDGYAAEEEDSFLNLHVKDAPIAAGAVHSRGDHRPRVPRHPLPRALPGLLRHAVANGWNVHTAHPDRDDRSFRLSCHRDGDVVFIVWIPDGMGRPGDAPWRVWKSSINGTPTPYTQCTRLIRSEETP